jgi:hypothetical protein
MTGAQAPYLKTLCEQADDPDAFDTSLTKAEASKRIDELKARTSRTASRLPRIVCEMLLYKFTAAIPWRVALTKDETGENLPAEGAA